MFQRKIWDLYNWLHSRALVNMKRKPTYICLEIAGYKDSQCCSRESCVSALKQDFPHIVGLIHLSWREPRLTHRPLFPLCYNYKAIPLLPAFVLVWKYTTQLILRNLIFVPCNLIIKSMKLCMQEKISLHSSFLLPSHLNSILVYNFIHYNLLKYWMPADQFKCKTLFNFNCKFDKSGSNKVFFSAIFFISSSHCPPCCFCALISAKRKSKTVCYKSRNYSMQIYLENTIHMSHIFQKIYRITCTRFIRRI